MESLTREQAITLAESGVWKEWTHHQRVEFQLFVDLLCMDFSAFHESIEHVLGRQVFTHEFAYPEHLRKEFLRDKPAPSLSEVLALIPTDKLVLV